MVTHVCQFGLNGQIRNYVFKSAKKVFGNITNELLAWDCVILFNMVEVEETVKIKRTLSCLLEICFTFCSSRFASDCSVFFSSSNANICFFNNSTSAIILFSTSRDRFTITSLSICHKETKIISLYRVNFIILSKCFRTGCTATNISSWSLFAWLVFTLFGELPWWEFRSNVWFDAHSRRLTDSSSINFSYWMPRVSVVRTSLSALLTPSRTACEKRVERGKEDKEREKAIC